MRAAAHQPMGEIAWRATRDAVLSALPVSDIVGDEVDGEDLAEALIKVGWVYTGRPCHRCEGCGQLANDDERTPWTFWANLKPPSNIAVVVGMVRPEPCDECNGTGTAAVAS